jgi:hypothetical protein
MDNEEGHRAGKEEKEGGAAAGGKACGPYTGAVQLPFDVAVGSAAVWWYVPNSQSTATSSGGWPPAAIGLGGRCLLSGPHGGASNRHLR